MLFGMLVQSLRSGGEVGEVEVLWVSHCHAERAPL